MTGPDADPRRRRILLAALPLAAGGVAAGCSAPAPDSAPSQATPPAPAEPDRHGWRIPAGFEPTQAIWLGHDPGHEALTAELIGALHGQVALKFLVRDDAGAQALRRLIVQRRLPLSDPEIHIDARAVYFVRDIAVFARGPQGQAGVIDFRWTHYGQAPWCRSRHAGDSAALAACIAETAADTGRDQLERQIARWTDAAVFNSGLALEGGSIAVNGQGTLIANEAYLRQRNPDWSHERIEAELLALPGLRKVIWLPAGLAEDPQMRATITGDHVGWGTGGHTDEFVRFSDARTVLLAWPDDEAMAQHPVVRINRQRMQRNLDILQEASNADGQSLKVIRLPLPRLIEQRIFLSAASDPGWSDQWSAGFFPPAEGRREGQPVWRVAAASTINHIVANGIVVAPGYLRHGTPAALHERIRRALELAYPGRRIVFVDALKANWYGGGPHCASLNEPA